MSSPAVQLDRARKDRLLDLTLRNPLISHTLRKTRGVGFDASKPVELNRTDVGGSFYFQIFGG